MGHQNSLPPTRIHKTRSSGCISCFATTTVSETRPAKSRRVLMCAAKAALSFGGRLQGVLWRLSDPLQAGLRGCCDRSCRRRWHAVIMFDSLSPMPIRCDEAAMPKLRCAMQSAGLPVLRKANGTKLGNPHDRDDVGLDLAADWSKPKLLGDRGCRNIRRFR